MADAAQVRGGDLRQRAEQLAQPLPPLLVAAHRIANTVAQGVHGRRRVGAGESFWQFRRYQPGDAAQQIDWRQSAKSQKAFVRENEWEAAQSVWLWRDASASMDYRSAEGPTSKRERADLLLLALAALLIRGGERVALLGTGARPRTGRVALGRLAEAVLAEDRRMAGWDASLPSHVPLPGHAQLVVIGDLLSPLDELEPLIKSYAGAGVFGHLLQVVDPAEEDLPFQGRVRFEGPEAEGGLTVGRVEALRADYLALLEDRRRRLTTLVHRIGWTITQHRTDRPPELALLALHQAISGAFGRVSS